MEPFSKAKEIISRVRYMTIASVSEDGQPWNAPVYFGFDERCNLYWTSAEESQHSRNIERNRDVFIVIYDSTVPEGTGLGVYIQARARALGDEGAITRAAGLLYARAGKEPPAPEAFCGDRPRRMYEAVPDRIWVNAVRSVGTDLVDVRVEVEIGP